MNKKNTYNFLAEHKKPDTINFVYPSHFDRKQPPTNPNTAGETRLLDADADGLVELEEFVHGCLNLHGAAKSALKPLTAG